MYNRYRTKDINFNIRPFSSSTDDLDPNLVHFSISCSFDGLNKFAQKFGYDGWENQMDVMRKFFLVVHEKFPIFHQVTPIQRLEDDNEVYWIMTLPK